MVRVAAIASDRDLTGRVGAAAGPLSLAAVGRCGECEVQVCLDSNLKFTKSQEPHCVSYGWSRETARDY